MIASIRLRIVLSIVTVVVALLLAQSLYVLDRVRSAGLNEIDGHLERELTEALIPLRAGWLQEHIERAISGRRKWDELFIELRDSAGNRIAGSANLPADGLVSLEREDPQAEIWEATHPASRKRHRKIRIREHREGDLVLLVAVTMQRQQKTYWLLRERLAWGTLAIAAISTLAGWLVASRTLAPIERISNRARELQSAESGSLPRTGNDDELDRLAAVLNELLERVRGEVGRMRRMLADAGHALRTPLTAVRGNLELLLRRATGEDAEDLAGIMEQVERQARMVNDVLLLEKLDGPKTRTPDEVVDLAALVEGLVEHLEVLGQEDSVELKCKTSPTFVSGHSDELRQAVANLVDNALRHTPPGGHVEVCVRQRGALAEVAVSDSGPGVPAGDVERVFERFYSSAQSGTGTGLGLPIARAIAVAHGGELVALPHEDGGRFRLRLPALAE